MAAIQVRNGSYRVLFRHHGKQHTFTLGRVSQAEARAKADQVDYLLMRVSQGFLTLPVDADIVTFLRRDGSLPVVASATRDAPTPVGLRDRYRETHEGSLEAHRLRGIRRHFRHLVRLLGEVSPIRELSLADLQEYVDKRAKAKGRRGPLTPTTIRKEIVKLRTVDAQPA